MTDATSAEVDQINDEKRNNNRDRTEDQHITRIVSRDTLARLRCRDHRLTCGPVACGAPIGLLVFGRSCVRTYRIISVCAFISTGERAGFQELVGNGSGPQPWLPPLPLIHDFLSRESTFRPRLQFCCSKIVPQPCRRVQQVFVISGTVGSHRHLPRSLGSTESPMRKFILAIEAARCRPKPAKIETR